MTLTLKTPPSSNREPLPAIAIFWLHIVLTVPAWGFLFSISLNGSIAQFALAAICVIAVQAATIVGMIGFIGFRKSPARITIMLLLTAFFAIVQGSVIFNMISQSHNIE